MFFNGMVECSEQAKYQINYNRMAQTQTQTDLQEIEEAGYRAHMFKGVEILIYQENNEVYDELNELLGFWDNATNTIVAVFDEQTFKIDRFDGMWISIRQEDNATFGYDYDCEQEKYIDEFHGFWDEKTNTLIKCILA